MGEEKTRVKYEEDLPERTGLVLWIKEHRRQLLFVGISVTTIIITTLGLKNKESINGLWESLKKEIEKGSLYSSKWFEKASLEEIQKARKIVQKDYGNPELDNNYRSECWELLLKLNNAIEEKKWIGKEPGYPVHSEHGWHLLSDD